jgi:hypothetical protein
MGNAVGKDDPIPVADKIKTWQMLYPQYANNISAVTMEGGTLMQKIKHELINPLPGKLPRYDNIIIMVGEDQAKMPIAGALMKAVNKFPGYENVKVHLEVTPRGTGMSFTKLRDILKTGNPDQAFQLWNDAFNGGQFGAKQLPPEWIRHLMDVTRNGMGIKEPQTQQPVAEQRLFNSLLRPQVKKEKQGVAEGSEQSLSSMVNQDQSERNEYKNFVKSQAGGDWSKGAKMYAQIKKRPSNDIFGDASRLNQFMKMKFDFDKFTDEDWDNYWLLAQHCDDNRNFQKNALSIIKKYQGTDHSHYKYLYDRISMGLTGKQKYGTQNTIKQGVAENFADGKNPGRKGLAKRSGVNTKASVSSLRKTAKHSTGEKARMAHWLANMKAGRAKKK